MRLAALLVALVLSSHAHATSFSTDASDLWFNVAEQGWGMNVVQQMDTLFVTIYVYGQDGQPTWFVASSVTPQDGRNAVPITYAGDLYRVTGPYFGGAFNPSAVNVRKVGTIVFRLDTVNTAQVDYVADGVTVSKAVVRQTWKDDTALAGTYLGGTAGTYSGCAVSGAQEEAAVVTVSQQVVTPATASSKAVIDLTMDVRTDLGDCRYSGRYAQSGRMGTVTGSVVCTPSLSGSFTMDELQVNPSGLMARVTQEAGGCRWTGRIGGLRRGP